MGYYIASRKEIYFIGVTDGPHLYAVHNKKELEPPYELREQAMGDLNASMNHAYKFYPNDVNMADFESICVWDSDSYVIKQLISSLP